MLFFKKKLNESTASDILASFATWMHEELRNYNGSPDTSMLKNISTTHPSVFNDLTIGKNTVEHYFIMSNTSDQRVATRLAIFVSKLNLIFGSDMINQFKERCIESMLVDYHIDKNNLESYLKLSDLFWTYPVLLMMGTLELREIVVQKSPDTVSD